VVLICFLTGCASTANCSLPLHDALPILLAGACARAEGPVQALFINVGKADAALFLLGDQRFLVDTGTKGSYDQLERVLDAYGVRSEEHTSELQSRFDLVCRLLLEKKKKY